MNRNDTTVPEPVTNNAQAMALYRSMNLPHDTVMLIRNEARTVVLIDNWLEHAGAGEAIALAHQAWPTSAYFVVHATRLDEHTTVLAVHGNPDMRDAYTIGDQP